MICSVCKRDVASQRTVIRKGELISGCEYCLDESFQKSNEFNANHNRNAQRAEYRKDITQAWDSRNYYKAYPEDARKRFGDDIARKFS